MYWVKKLKAIKAVDFVGQKSAPHVVTSDSESYNSNMIHQDR